MIYKTACFRALILKIGLSLRSSSRNCGIRLVDDDGPRYCLCEKLLCPAMRDQSNDAAIFVLKIIELVYK